MPKRLTIASLTQANDELKCAIAEADKIVQRLRADLDKVEAAHEQMTNRALTAEGISSDMRAIALNLSEALRNGCPQMHTVHGDNYWAKSHDKA